MADNGFSGASERPRPGFDRGQTGADSAAAASTGAERRQATAENLAGQSSYGDRFGSKMSAPSGSAQTTARPSVSAGAGAAGNVGGAGGQGSPIAAMASAAMSAADAGASAGNAAVGFTGADAARIAGGIALGAASKLVEDRSIKLQQMQNAQDEAPVEAENPVENASPFETSADRAAERVDMFSGKSEEKAKAAEGLTGKSGNSAFTGKSEIADAAEKVVEEAAHTGLFQKLGVDKVNLAMDVAAAAAKDETSVAGGTNSLIATGAARAVKQARAGKGKGAIARGAIMGALAADNDSVVGDTVHMYDTAKNAKSAYSTVKGFLSNRKASKAAKDLAKGEIKRRYAQRKSMDLARGKAQEAARAAVNMAGKAVQFVFNGIKSLIGWLAGLLPVGFPAVVPVLVIVILIGAFVGGASGLLGQSDSGSLQGNEAEVAKKLKEYGFDNLHVAAIMGNWVIESNCNPKQLQHFDGSPYCANKTCDKLDDYPSEYILNGKIGYGLAQWTSPGRSMGLVRWADKMGKHSGDMDVQIDYFYNAEYKNRLWAPNFEKITDISEATVYFHNKYEISADDASRLQKRIDQAERIYTALNNTDGTGGQDLADASEAGKKIYEAAMSTDYVRLANGTVYTGSAMKNWCGAWVSTVYQNAGFSRPGGNGNSILNSSSHTSSNFDEIEVGMILSAQYGVGSAGKAYGHTAIYVGNGYVRENDGSIHNTKLSDWLKTYGTGWVKFGWPW